ncbi:MAG: class I SAM-dependent methyltransferase, partial [Armatimonadetes bacterium]|nr:class I SAM-dependent methyltransferase [Armatimonadota bacterium]
LGPGVLPEDEYDAVTMRHVLEHLHDPNAAMRCCYRALKPGGELWLATPRLRSYGHRAYDRYWYALDPPRHLVLFTADTLEGMLRRAGFASIRSLPPYPFSSPFVLAGSRGVATRDKLVPSHAKVPSWPRWREAAAVLGAMFGGRGEELVYHCVKPHANGERESAAVAKNVQRTD